MSKKCISCGAELEDSALYCDECGVQQTNISYNELIDEELKNRQSVEETLKNSEEEQARLEAEKESKYEDRLKKGTISSIVSVVCFIYLMIVHGDSYSWLWPLDALLCLVVGTIASLLGLINPNKWGWLKIVAFFIFISLVGGTIF